MPSMRAAIKSCLDTMAVPVRPSCADSYSSAICCLSRATSLLFSCLLMKYLTLFAYETHYNAYPEFAAQAMVGKRKAILVFVAPYITYEVYCTSLQSPCIVY